MRRRDKVVSLLASHITNSRGKVLPMLTACRCIPFCGVADVELASPWCTILKERTFMIPWCHVSYTQKVKPNVHPFAYILWLFAVGACGCIQNGLPCAWLQNFKTAQSQVVGRFHVQCGLFGHHGLFAPLGGWMWVWAFGTTSSRSQITFCGQSGLLVQSLCFLPLLCVHAFDGACL